MKEMLRIHDFIDRTRTTGPGLRASLWVQGCSLNCPGCFNPSTHSFKAGEIVAVEEIFRRISSIDGIEGISILGGEPLQQRRGVVSLLRSVRAKTDLSVVLFSGYTFDEIAGMPEGKELFALVDVLIAGRYDERLRLARGLRGSSNKYLHVFTKRYSEEDLNSVPACEITIDDGVVTISGMDPLLL